MRQLSALLAYHHQRYLLEPTKGGLPAISYHPLDLKVIDTVKVGTDPSGIAYKTIILILILILRVLSSQ